MTDLKREHERVLENPSNIIMSEGLDELLGNETTDRVDGEVEAHENMMQGELQILGQEYLCKIKKIQKQSKNIFDFKIEVPAFPINYFLECDDIKLKFCNYVFSSEETSNISFRDDGILTFKARRTVNNEAV